MLIKPPTCVGCPLYGAGVGFVPADGTGENGVLIVLEAAGADEEVDGIPVVGAAGRYLFTQLAKAGIARDGFRIHNVLSCRPPNNKLAGMPYEAAAIAHCTPHLDATIRAHTRDTRAREGTPVILALGRLAFGRIMGWERGDARWRYDYQAYVHRSDRYDCWVVAADHPAFLMRGQHQAVPVLQFAAQRALEVARDGFTPAAPSYVCDPRPDVFAAWVRDYLRALDRGDDVYLSVDIETPYKLKRDEEQLAREEDDDYIILRCSFSWQPGTAISIPWQAGYMAAVEELLGDARNRLVTWNGNYDLPRLRAQLTVRGESHDAMLAWHVLNSALDKRLGYVAPFYCKTFPMWKHLSGDRPAWYNAADADVALSCYLGIRADLSRSDQLAVFQRHIIDLHRVTDHMSAIGLLRDDVMRAAAETQLTTLLTATEAAMAAAIPQEARREQVYKTKPAQMAGVLARPVQREVPVCSRCGAPKPTKPHFRSFKRPTSAKPQNPCAGGEVVQRLAEVQQYYRLLDWKASKVQLQSYQASLRHQAIINRKENKVTFDEDAILQLERKYPKDPLYPLLLTHRKYQKLLGTYIGKTVVEEVKVPDDYVLKPGEEWADAVAR